MRRPITQRAKSPLKETDEVTLGKTTRVASPGEDITTEVSKPGEVIGGGYSGPGMGNEAWKKYLASETPEQRDKRHAREVKDGVRKAPTTETVVTKGEPVITTEKQQFTPQTADNYTGITPWENRFNMRTARQSERFSRNEAKRDLRRNAKEAARDTRQDGGSFLEGRNARRDIMTGKSFQNERQENLYNTSRGLTDDQNTVYKTDMQKNQFDKGIVRGEEFTGTPRDMTIYDVGTGKGQTTLNNYKASAPGFEIDLGANTSTSKANEGAANMPTTNKVNGTGASSKAAMRPSVGLNAEFKGASVPSAPDLVAAKKARQVAQERKENTIVSTDKLGSKSASIPTPESKGASKLVPISAPKPSAGSNFAGTGMSKSELGDLSEALTDRKNAGVREANKFTAGSIQANTGTADRSSYNRTSPGLSDGTPTRKDSDRSVISAAQMRYESNVGIKEPTPMKKGYFKGK